MNIIAQKIYANERTLAQCLEKNQGFTAAAGPARMTSIYDRLSRLTHSGIDNHEVSTSILLYLVVFKWQYMFNKCIFFSAVADWRLCPLHFYWHREQGRGPGSAVLGNGYPHPERNPPHIACIIHVKGTQSLLFCSLKDCVCVLKHVIPAGTLQLCKEHSWVGACSPKCVMDACMHI